VGTASFTFTVSDTGGKTSTEGTVNITVIDNIPPTVSSITPADANPTKGGTLHFTVMFSEAVSGVNASNFAVVENPTVTAGTIGVVGNGSTYTVTVDGVGGDGSLRLDLSNTGGIQDTAGNAMTATFTGGQSYRVDNTAPTLVNKTGLAGHVNQSITIT